ncbi:MAG TPA: sigma-70 family RNA polymerase sigma factor [Caldimonas sp.]|nr:sigma-70 family RNA polymerase sigma factor [Caldimonas sp.]
MAGSTAEGSQGDGSPAGADLIGVLEEARRRFLGLVADVRPELLRYCARMTGSIADGEDVVQDTLARAYYELSQLEALPPLRPWLFRIAHHRAIDHWRREARRASEPLDAAEGVADDAALEPENATARRQAIHAAIASFLALAPAQRGCMILKDVLDHSLDEIAAELGLSVQAVKAALHRGRVALQAASAVAPDPRPPAGASPELKRYAALFGAHDWDGVRALLADDVRLDLVSRRKAAGRRDVARYFGNYARTPGWHVAPAWFDGREVLAVEEAGSAGARRYVIELAWRESRVIAIRDFRYVPYIVQEGAMEELT